MDDGQRKIAVLRAERKFGEANALEYAAQQEQTNLHAVAADVTRLRDELAQLAGIVRTLMDHGDKDHAAMRELRKALLDSMEPMKKILSEQIERRVYELSRDLEKEFQVALTVPGRAISDGGRQSAAEAALQSFERRLSRNAEHVAALETRLKKLER